MDRKEAENVVRQACALLVANLETHQKVQAALEVVFTPEPVIETPIAETQLTE